MLLTFFENLIVPHALHCIDGCFFCILPHLTVWHTVLVSAQPHPPHPEKNNNLILFRFVKRTNNLRIDKSFVVLSIS